MQLRINYSGRNRKNSKILDFARKYYILTAAGLVALVVGVGPLIADQLTGGSDPNNSTETATVESSVSPSPISSESSSPTPTSTESTAGNSDSGTVTYANADPSASPTPTKIPPFAVSDQSMNIRIPQVLRIDPRAKQVSLPSVFFEAQGSPFLMLCIDSSRAFIDVENKGLDNSISNKSVFISGDLSPNIQISGTSSEVVNILNSFGGLKLVSGDGKGIDGTALYMRFVAISEPTDNFALCGEFKTHWRFELQPLGIQLDTKKNPVPLGNKGKK